MPECGDAGHPTLLPLTPDRGAHVRRTMNHTIHDATPVVVRMFEAACVVPAERTAWLAAGFEPSVALNFISAGASLDEAVDWRHEGSDANTFARYRNLLRTSGLYDDSPPPQRRRSLSGRRSGRDPSGPLVTVRLRWDDAIRDRARPGCAWEVWAPTAIESPFRGKYEVVCADAPPGATSRSMRTIGLGPSLHRTLRGALQHIGEAAFTVRGQLEVSLQPASESTRPLLLEALPRLVPIGSIEHGMRCRERPKAPDFVLLE